MPTQIGYTENWSGLTDAEVGARQQEFGKNRLEAGSSGRLLPILRGGLGEPMFLLLVAACTLYFLLGQVQEGLIMLGAMVLVTAISLYQEVRSSKALQALRQLTEPKVAVVRNHRLAVVPSEELVPGDLVVLEEGCRVPADAEVVQQNDLFVNESLVTGESLPVEKKAEKGLNVLYQGALVDSGKCYAVITATGTNTFLGKLGRSISSYVAPPTPLQQQVNAFVRRLAFFGLCAFLVIFVLNFTGGQNVFSSLLFALTLAMAAVPEEIPVAFSSFMALGAFYLSRLGVITRQPQVVENLGAITVLCLDKTGTITENVMTVQAVYDYRTGRLLGPGAFGELPPKGVLWYGVLACEREPFDSMEQAIHRAYAQSFPGSSLPAMIHEYPLEGRPPMMTHVYGPEAAPVVAGKGAAERILKVCSLPAAGAEKVRDLLKGFASQGCRVIAVASARHPGGAFPPLQDDFSWELEGLISLYDPPRTNVAPVLAQLYGAGIAIKLITGDHPETARSISKQVGLRGAERCLTGEQVAAMSPEALQQAAGDTVVFARMFPDAKLKVIEALKARGEVVAMTGDGINDGPALKAAHVGIAMGRKGTETARQSADVILTDDNLERVVTAVAQGRRIFTNLVNAFRYIISIHIPIILTASLPLLFSWKYANLLTPVHVIFLELIMGPTCSLFFEQEPMEQRAMARPPRDRKGPLFAGRTLALSIVQGCMITLAVLFLAWRYMQGGYPLAVVRSVVFTTLILSNILLTFTGRSLTETLFQTLRYRNPLVLPVFGISLAFLAFLQLAPLAWDLFRIAPLGLADGAVCLAAALIGVGWVEAYKGVAGAGNMMAGSGNKRLAADS
ncbi:cation-translocating P-type ATPase [Paraflavisolibacter sp. H34]|uniref:cation-translocating P-type ATPase n=1 Tax=Huijunlia imazamoxiresistens TaxID=3127457 RepID=UPI00301ADA7C